MKKVFGIVLVGLLATACSSKVEDPNTESNVMLVEPKVETTSVEEIVEEKKVTEEVTKEAEVEVEKKEIKEEEAK